MTLKLALMTWYHYRNYGTALQVSALSRVLRTMGHDPSVIQYKPKWYFPQIPDYRLVPLAKRLLRHNSQIKRPSVKEYCPEAKERLFVDYLNDTLRYTGECVTKSDLEALNDEFDAFICGSDQIWSPLCYNARYYLDFVHDPTKKIAYAPSLGVRTWDDLYIKRAVADLLRDFDAISVREEEGQKLIRECSGKDASVVLDPTLLLPAEEWSQWLPNEIKLPETPYLLLYQLGTESTHLEEARRTADRLGLELQIIPVWQEDLSKQGCIEEPIGPREFLAWVRGASYVVTDSFHGMTISVLFHRPFTALPRFRPKDPRNQNSRVLQLLRTVSMEDRLFNGKNAESIAATSPDFNRADAALEKRRASSLRFLKDALQHAREARPLLRRVTVQNSLCCGCGACEQTCPTGAIQLTQNENGFWEPQILSDKCVNCGKCIQVCPFCTETRSGAARDADLFSFKSENPEVLQRSSSGGAADCLARILLQKGYSVAGCRFNQALQRAEHVVIHNPEELRQLQGSKYIQSYFVDALRELKQCSGPAAIFGTPCQIAAARRIIEDREDVVYIDLVCHGIPTAHLFRRYRQYIKNHSGVDMSKAEMSFRYKPKGWRLIYLFASDGEHEYCRDQKNDPFFRLFEVGACYSEACYDCRWRADSEADIRLADYWGPKFAEDETGVSMVVCYTPHGKKLAAEMAASGRLLLQPIDDYLRFQAQSNPPKPPFYQAVIRDLQNDSISFETLADKYAIPLGNRSLSRKERIRYVMKMIAYDQKYLKK